jgi:hypothetical protein
MAREMAPSLLRSAVVAALAGTFMALVGAFGSGNAPLAPRLIYWIGSMMGGAMIGTLLSPVLSQRPKIGDNPLLLWAVVSLAVTLPGTVFVWWFTGFMFGARGVGALPFFFGSVLMVSSAMTAIMMMVHRPGPATHAPPGGSASGSIRFHARVPAKLKGGQIYAVEAEDHYLRVRTSKGADLILLRLSDAIVELEGLEGAQVHRSWWVARDGFTKAERRDGRVFLALKDGTEAPVSRANVKALKEAGWI